MLSQSGEQDQGPGHCDGHADAGGDLRERHQLHPVGHRQHRNVAGVALAAVAGVHDRRPDRVHAEPASDKNQAAIKAVTIEMITAMFSGVIAATSMSDVVIETPMAKRSGYVTVVENNCPRCGL
jgi:hypothetical protein